MDEQNSKINKVFFSRRNFLMTSSGLVGVGLSGCLGGPQIPESNNDNPDSFPPEEGTEWSEPVQVGDGKARTFITQENGDTRYIGIEFTEQVLEGLPEEISEYHLHLPSNNLSVFEWAGIDWTPQGRGPQEIYTIPHFDLHFVMDNQIHR